MLQLKGVGSETFSRILLITDSLRIRTTDGRTPSEIYPGQ